MSKSPPGGRIIRPNTRINDGAGYLYNDGRAAEEKLEEADILTCPHCQCTINYQAWRKDHSKGGTHDQTGGWCRKCEAPVCPTCTKRMLTHGCEPFMKMVDRIVKETHRREQNRKILGNFKR